MKPLSEQLSELSDRAKKAEDFVAVARTKNRAALDSQRESLKSSIGEGKARAEAEGAAAQSKVQSWWDGTRSAVDEQFDTLHARLDERRADRDAKRAEDRADEAEEDAAYAVQFAISTLDQAEYAIADAVLARADADDLAAEQLS
jgi:vacuolar-type H+-ATPase subunit I/STV1